MARFRKKPVVIEAEQYLAGPVDGFCNAPHCPLPKPHIHTLEGLMSPNRGDWIITGVQGERYLCKPDIFDATYEPVDEGA